MLLGMLVAITQLTDSLAEATLLDALIFWAGRIVGAVGSLLLAERLVATYLDGLLESPVWLKPAVVSMLIAAVPMTIVEIGLESAIPQKPEYDDSSLRDWSPFLASVGEYATIVSLLVPINFVLWLVIDHRHAQPRPNDEFATEPEFLSKTGGVKLDDVIALGAEEHYVRVCASDRSELIYHRFRDAIAEMPDSLGMQVHRSWWVADTGVIGARRAGRRYQLQLSNGTVVPVSDRFVKPARRRGLLVTRT